MTRSVSLETASSVALIARQLGAVVSNEQIGEEYTSGGCRDEGALTDYFSRYDISVYFKKLKKTDLEKKQFLYPCVLINKDGSSSVLIGLQSEQGTGKKSFKVMDVFSSTLGAENKSIEDVIGKWSGTIAIVGKKSDQPSKERLFDFDWFLPELVRFKWLFAVAFLMSLILHGIAFAPIIFIQIALDKVVGYQAMSTLYVLTIGVFFALVFSGIMGYLRDYIVNVFAASLEARMSGDLFDKMLALPIYQMDANSATRLEESVQSLTGLKMFISRNVLSATFEAAGLLVFLPILFLYSTLLGFIVLGFAIFLGTSSYIFKNIEKKRSAEYYREERNKLTVLRETVAGIDNVKALSQEPIQRRAWRETSFKSIESSRARDNITAVSTNFNATIQQFMTIAVIFVGIQLVFAGSLSAGAIIAVNMVAARVIRPVGILISSFGEMEGAKASVGKIAEIWNASPERKSIGTSVNVQGKVECKDLALTLGGKEVLKNVSFSVPANSIVAVVGPAASGKTTLLKIIQGFIKPTVGSVLIDGRSLLSLDLENYRSQVSMVTANPSFFTGTIEENLRRARRNISERELREATMLSGLDSIISNIEEGLAYRLDNATNSLPSSYRGIIALARAVVSDPKILLFDEIFANLDKSLQSELLDKMPAIAKNKTLFFVTHDIRVANTMSLVLVMEDGEVVGLDEPSKLLGTCDLYKKLWALDNYTKAKG